MRLTDWILALAGPMLLLWTVLLVLVSLALVAVWLRVSRPPCLRQRVILNLVGESFALRGILWQQRGPWSVLRHAELLQSGQPPQRMDGETVIERRRVSFIQLLGPEP